MREVGMIGKQIRFALETIMGKNDKLCCPKVIGEQVNLVKEIFNGKTKTPRSNPS